MYGNKSLPERLDIIGPKGQVIPNAKINIEYYVTKEEFRKMLYEEKLKYAEIAERIDFPYDLSNFSRIVRKLGWKTDTGKVDKYTVNEQFFNSWSKESAWVYGWLITDGHVNKRYIDLTLQKTDSDVLDKIKDITNFSGPKYKRERKETIRIYNRNLVDSLFNIGFPKENKTFTCGMPDLHDEYMWHFIRGAFEGDGSISTSNLELHVSFCGASVSLLNGINEFLNKNGIKTSLYVQKENLLVIRASGMESALKWLYFMYADTDAGIRMDRKFNKFVDFTRSFYSIQRKAKGAAEIVELARQTIPECYAA